MKACYHYFLMTREITSSTHTRCAKCAKCQIFGTFGTPNTKIHKISNILNLIIFTTCYRIFTYLTRYGNLWYMVLLFVYSSFSLSWSVPRFWVFRFVTSVAYGTNILTFVATIPSPHLWLQWHSPQVLK